MNTGIAERAKSRAKVTDLDSRAPARIIPALHEVGDEKVGEVEFAGHRVGLLGHWSARPCWMLAWWQSAQ
jgi:hypothetical protein